MKPFHFGISFTLLFFWCSFGHSQSDLSRWQAEGYPDRFEAPPNWTLSENNQSAIETANSYPAFLVSDFGSVFQEQNFRVRIDPQGTTDDDFLGFAIGFSPGDSTNPNANYLLVDWKKFSQNFDGSLALAGLSISRVSGIPTDSFPNFWDHSGSVEELQRAENLGDVGWDSGVIYEFEISISSEAVVISVNGSEEINLLGSFDDGGLAFYSSSNVGVSYSTDFGLTLLDTWSFEGYSANDPGVWSVGNSQRTTFQSTNSEGSFFVSDRGTLLDQESFQVQIRAPSDDDFFGFALGYHAGDTENVNADYLLVDWKRTAQGQLNGLAVSRVTGIPSQFPGLWEHTGQVAELQRAANLGSTGWIEGENYTFDVIVQPNSLAITVNGIEEIRIDDIEIPEGGLAFYTFAQPAEFSTNFGSAFVLQGDFDADGDVDCDDLDGYVGNLAMAATGTLAALDFDGDGFLSQTDADSVITTLVMTSNGVVGTFPGDLNCDGQVNVLGDAFALVGNLGNSVTSYSQGDINFDGTVNVLGDAFALVGNLGQSNGP